MELLVMSRDNQLFQTMKQLGISVSLWARNIREAKQMLISREVKMIIIDLQGQEKEGFSLALYIRGIHRHYLTPLIILAENNHYENQSFSEVHCFAYYTKPLRDERLFYHMNRIMSVMDPSYVPTGLVFHTKNGIHRVEISDVCYLEILKHTLYVHTSYDVLEYPYRTMSSCLEQGRGKLLQCHRSMAINRDYIRYVDYGNRAVYLKGEGQALDIGPKYVKTLWETLMVRNEKCIL